MKQKQDLKSQIYESDKILDQTIQRMLKDPAISQANKDNITAFLEDSKSAGTTTTRLAICAASLKRLSRLTKADFQAFTQADAKALMKALEGSKYGDWTKMLDKTVFRQLMRSYKRPADVYDWIKIGEPPSQLKKEDLLSPDEVRSLITAAPDTMWKALLSLMAESGCRPGEALNLTVGSVKVNSDHIKLYVAGKMARSSGERPLFLFKTYDVLKAWLEEHPFKSNPESPLWITRRTAKPIGISALNVMFKRISKRAGITKRCFPYLLRHCKGTEVYLKYAPALAMKMMGHSDTKTGLVYTHLAEEDVLSALQQEHGLKPKQQVVDDAELCQACGHQNPYGSIQCNNCKAGLGAAGAIKIQQEHDAELEELKQLKELLQDPQIISLLKALKNPEVIEVVKSTLKRGS